MLYLGGDKQFLPGNPGLFDSNPNFGLGPVDLGTVKMTMPDSDGTLDGLDCGTVEGVFLLFVPGGPRAESEGGDECTPGEFDKRDCSGCH